MSTFDNPFDPDRRLQAGCACGQHRSAAEHEQSAAALRCAPVESEEKRYEDVVASAVMRAMFPQDMARRAFLKSVGASTALAALSQFFPLQTATEVFAQAGAPEKKDLKVGFIPITCATPIIMAAPMGFYSKHGLNVEVVKTAGWAVIRDKTINKEYDAAHMLAPMPIAISLGLGANAIPFAVPAIENINGQGAGDQAQGQARSEGLEGPEVRDPLRLFHAQLPAAVLSRRARHRSRYRRAAALGAAAGDGRQSPRRQHRRLPRAGQHLPARDL
jgi:nitrate/nitrite transport system substrate-binding protein